MRLISENREMGRFEAYLHTWQGVVGCIVSGLIVITQFLGILGFVPKSASFRDVLALVKDPVRGYYVNKTAMCRGQAGALDCRLMHQSRSYTYMFFVGTVEVGVQKMLAQQARDLDVDYLFGPALRFDTGEPFPANERVIGFYVLSSQKEKFREGFDMDILSGLFSYSY